MLKILVILGLLGYAGYLIYIHIYLAEWHPEEYAKFKQRQHEEKMAKLAAQKAEQNQKTANVASGLAKALLSALFKRH